MTSISPDQKLQEKTSIIEVFESQKKHSGKLREEKVEDRIRKLKKIKSWIHENRIAIQEAIYKDFQKPAEEVDITETFVVLTEVNHALKNLKKWMRSVKVSTPINFLGTKSFIQYEPKGVALIISPWNFPFNLCLGPLVSAIAAGNTVILKPSEMTPHTSQLIDGMVRQLFHPSEVAVFLGDMEVSQDLLRLPFDHIFFTGSPSVGKVVMRAAAENLSSITLELGGKSPLIIDESAGIKDAAEKIAWSKFLNSGQTCIAPDYLMVPEKILDPLVQEIRAALTRLYDPLEEGMDHSPYLARIVNRYHFDRVCRLLDDTLQEGGKVVIGGKVNREENFIEPTVLTNLPNESEMLEEEIFGPLLPIITYKTTQEVVDFINGKPKPLALYIFSRNKKIVNFFLKNISSGTSCINDAVLHFLHINLPFGGVNNSGIGKSHGYYGFLAFSNEKSVLKQRIGYTFLKTLYPPYSAFTKKLINLMLKYF